MRDLKIISAEDELNKLASLGATLVRNYDSLTYLLTGVKCRATSVAKKLDQVETSPESTFLENTVCFCN